MEHIAILSKRNLKKHPYVEWLNKENVSITLFASNEDPHATELKAMDNAGYNSIQIFDQWKNNRQIDFALLKAHRAHPFSHIIALSECDQLRAAELRQHLNISGQHILSAEGFRNKLMMKKYAIEAGLVVPDFAEVKTVFDVEDFISTRHGSFVVKPIDGAGAYQVHVLHNHQQIKKALASITAHLDESPFLMIEEYIDAPMLLVDGLMIGKEIMFASVSTYMNTCLESVKNLSLRGVLQLDEHDQKSISALNYVRSLIKYMPHKTEMRSFHCELFDHPTRGIMLCEIAGRTGGARIRDMMKAKYNVDLDHLACLGQLGRMSFNYQSPLLKLDKLFGYVVLPSPGKRLLAKPDACSISGVVNFNIAPELGDKVPIAQKASDFVVDVLFGADNRQTLEKIYCSVVRWIEAEIVWE